MGRYEVDEDFGNEIQDLGAPLKRFSNHTKPMKVRLSSICSL
jgi:hypothetical protein